MGGGHSRAAEEERDAALRRVEEVMRQLNEAHEAGNRAKNDMTNARNDAEQARRDADEARNRAHNDSTAREEAQRLEREARQREQDAVHRQQEAQRAKEEADRKAREWQQTADDAERARQCAERAREEAETARRAAEERLMRGIPPDVRPTPDDLHHFRSAHGYGTHALNIAVTGESGVGKSALLNAVRGLYPDDEGAAEVGVNETTAVVQGYVDPNQPNVKWFDVPGANTPNVSGWMYFMDQHLYIFDILVVVFSDRFTQTVGTILSNAHKCGIPTFLVRTKGDQLVSNLKEDRRGIDNARAIRMLVNETTKMANKNLEKLSLPIQPTYIVSVKGMRKWVNDGDASDAIDDQRVYQMIFPQSVSRGLPDGRTVVH